MRPTHSGEFPRDKRARSVRRYSWWARQAWGGRLRRLCGALCRRTRADPRPTLCSLSRRPSAGSCAAAGQNSVPLGGEEGDRVHCPTEVSFPRAAGEPLYGGGWRSAASGKIVPDLAGEFAGRKGAGATKPSTQSPAAVRSADPPRPAPRVPCLLTWERNRPEPLAWAGKPIVPSGLL